MTCNLLRVTSEELEAYLTDSTLLADRLNKEADDACLYDIDKAWDGIVYLLTGKTSSDADSPLSRIIFSRQLVDKNQNLGSGPAHYLLPEEVAILNNQIAIIHTDELRPRFNPAEMKEIGVYPNAWDHEDALDYLVEYFETIQEVFSLAAERNEAIITFIT